MADARTPLSRADASNAVAELGWRLMQGSYRTSVAVDSMDAATEMATAAVHACGPWADRHLRVDVRPDRVELELQTRELAAVTARDVQLAESVSAAVAGIEMAGDGALDVDVRRPVQLLEIGIDALDIPAIRPFWKAVLACVDEPGSDDPERAIVDPAGQLPAIWFQQMDAPRPQRNRIHLDITVAHDQADARVRAALDAGGTLLTDEYAKSFWVLADAEGNEVCVCTWQDRDERRP